VEHPIASRVARDAAQEEAFQEVAKGPRRRARRRGPQGRKGRAQERDPRNARQLISACPALGTARRPIKSTAPSPPPFASFAPHCRPLSRRQSTARAPRFPLSPAAVLFPGPENMNRTLSLTALLFALPLATGCAGRTAPF